MRYGECTVGFEGAGPHYFSFCVGDFSRGASVVGVVVKHLAVLNQCKRFEAEGFEQISAAGFGGANAAGAAGAANTAGVAYTLIDFTQQHILNLPQLIIKNFPYFSAKLIQLLINLNTLFFIGYPYKVFREAAPP